MWKQISIPPTDDGRYTATINKIVTFALEHRHASICFSTTIYLDLRPSVKADDFDVVAFADDFLHCLSGKSPEDRRDITLSIFSALQEIVVRNPSDSAKKITACTRLGIEFDRRHEASLPSFWLIDRVEKRDRSNGKPIWIDSQGRQFQFTNTTQSGKHDFGKGTYSSVRAAIMDGKTEIAVKKFNDFAGEPKPPEIDWAEELGIAREFRLMQLLSEAHICPTPYFLAYFADSKGEHPIKMGMERCEDTLADSFRFERMPFDEGKLFAARLRFDKWMGTNRANLADFLLKLQKMHEKSLCHGDVKIFNALKSALNGTYYWGDFGGVSSLEQLLINPARRRLQSNPAPETLPAVAKSYPKSKDPAGRRKELLGADIWAVGMLFAMCVVDIEPRLNLFNFDPDKFGNESALQATTAFRGFLEREIPVFLTELERMTGPVFTDFIGRCLKIDPLERPTVAELLEHPLMQFGTPL